MFQRILVPLDGSALAECVLPHVVALARAESTQVFLLRVLDPTRSGILAQPIDPFEWQVVKAEAETYLKDCEVRLASLGVQTQAEILDGKAAETIIEYAQNQGIDLIILSSHGQSGLSGWNVSGVVQKTILRARRSTMIVRAYQPLSGGLGDLGYRRILLPLDGSQRAEVVLPLGKSLALACAAELCLAHVVKRPEMPRHAPPTQEDIDLANQVLERNRLEALRYLDEIKSRLNTRVETRLIMDDNVAASLHSLVKQENIDLVVMSAHGYTGDLNWPYGSLVISFIAYGTTPLLIVQDAPADRIALMPSEIAAREQGNR